VIVSIIKRLDLVFVSTHHQLMYETYPCCLERVKTEGGLMVEQDSVSIEKDPTLAGTSVATAEGHVRPNTPSPPCSAK